MESFLLTDRARQEARKMLEHFKATGSYSFPANIKYKLSDLRDSQMFGVLIAWTKNREEKILHAYSGSICSSYDVPGYVPPCFSVNEFNDIVNINDREIHVLTDKINNGEKDLLEKRAELSHETLRKLQEIYTFSTYNGERIHTVPSSSPTGTGDCAGLKLINYALRRGWEIKGLAEFKLDGTFYAPCKERCEPLLEKMLGLRFIYLDQDIAIINKQPGLLSVPGKGIEKLDSASYRFHTLFPSSPRECFVHRLDMDTSGILVLAFNKESVKALSWQFENREVHKTYIALLEGIIKEDGGIIDMPMRLDVDHRPYQIIDYENGKRAVTRWEKLQIVYRGKEKLTRVRFFPETGRTHQLRVHAKYGLNHPIKGDRLYGSGTSDERLCLHAESISFKHPKTGELMSFSVPADF